MSSEQHIIAIRTVHVAVDAHHCTLETLLQAHFHLHSHFGRLDQPYRKQYQSTLILPVSVISWGLSDIMMHIVRHFIDLLEDGRLDKVR